MGFPWQQFLLPVYVRLDSENLGQVSLSFSMPLPQLFKKSVPAQVNTGYAACWKSSPHTPSAHKQIRSSSRGFLTLFYARCRGVCVCCGWMWIGLGEADWQGGTQMWIGQMVSMTQRSVLSSRCVLKTGRRKGDICSLIGLYSTTHPIPVCQNPTGFYYSKINPWCVLPAVTSPWCLLGICQGIAI